MNELQKAVTAKLAVPLGHFQKEGVRKLCAQLKQYDRETPDRKKCVELLFSYVHHDSPAVTAETCALIYSLVIENEISAKEAYQALLDAASVKSLSGCAFQSVVVVVRRLLMAHLARGDADATWSLQTTSHPLSSLLATRGEEW